MKNKRMKNKYVYANGPTCAQMIEMLNMFPPDAKFFAKTVGIDWAIDKFCMHLGEDDECVVLSTEFGSSKKVHIT